MLRDEAHRFSFLWSYPNGMIFEHRASIPFQGHIPFYSVFFLALYVRTILFIYKIQIKQEPAATRPQLHTHYAGEFLRGEALKKWVIRRIGAIESATFVRRSEEWSTTWKAPKHPTNNFVPIKYFRMGWLVAYRPDHEIMLFVNLWFRSETILLNSNRLPNCKIQTKTPC